MAGNRGSDEDDGRYNKAWTPYNEYCYGPLNNATLEDLEYFLGGLKKLNLFPLIIQVLRLRKSIEKLDKNEIYTLIKHYKTVFKELKIEDFKSKIIALSGAINTKTTRKLLKNLEIASPIDLALYCILQPQSYEELKLAKRAKLSNKRLLELFKFVRPKTLEEFELLKSLNLKLNMEEIKIFATTHPKTLIEWRTYKMINTTVNGEPLLLVELHSFSPYPWLDLEYFCELKGLDLPLVYSFIIEHNLYPSEEFLYSEEYHIFLSLSLLNDPFSFSHSLSEYFSFVDRSLSSSSSRSSRCLLLSSVLRFLSFLFSLPSVNSNNLFSNTLNSYLTRYQSIFDNSC